MDESGKPKKKPTKKDWESPENRHKKQSAFKLYVAGRGKKEIMEAMGLANAKSYAAILTHEKWDKHAQIWRANPDDDQKYPWEVERVDKYTEPAVALENMQKDNRAMCVRAFSLYCTGSPINMISKELGIRRETLHMWAETQRWKICRERLTDDSSPAPWDDDNIPLSLGDMTLCMETMKKSIKFLVGSTLMKAAATASDLSGEEALGMTRQLKQLAESINLTFQEPQAANQIQVNIAAKLDSIKIPDNQTFEAELVVNE
jgi:hypothetical protein